MRAGDPKRLTPLVFAADESYAMPLATALRSIAEAKRTQDPLHVYILYNIFRDSTRRRVINSVPSTALSINWIHVDLRRFEAYPTGSYISLTTFARLMIPELLPRNISRVLYLDADILVLNDLEELQKSKLNGAAVGAVLDRLDSRLKRGETLWTEDLPSVKNYFNAGVLVIDLERWRVNRISERAFDYLREYPRSPLSDQDALNVVCDGAWAQLDPRWNFLNDHNSRITSMLQRPAIIHFAGPMKPWQIGVRDPNGRLYDLVRSRTLFARSKGDTAIDLLKAPLRFVESGVWWQVKRELRRFKLCRQIQHVVLSRREDGRLLKSL
jgi:lipopolysaccharide biosynthesis glycosyltransferase